MTTQTKRLSAATTVSTLAEGDKLAVVTEAGTTALVTKAKLKTEMGLGPKSASIAPLFGEWIRVAKMNSQSTGIVFVSNRYVYHASRPLIIHVGCSYEQIHSFVSAIGAPSNLYDKVRIVSMGKGLEKYLDVRSATGSRYAQNDYFTLASGIDIEALAPSIAPSVDGAEWVIESTPVVGGG